ncbi:MAG: hypothetical protein H7X80_11730, partial [bacterium]|nr:hypothetical protein [Candidatus Kapabacteria bacterium]
MWHDERKDAPGIYSTTVDTSGALLRPASQIIQSRTNGLTFRLFNAANDEYVLVWSTARYRDSLHALALTSDGYGVGNTIELGTSLSWLGQSVPGIDGWLLQADRTKWYAVGRRVDRIRAVAPQICDPFVVRSDGSALAVCGDSLRHFASLFDSTPILQTRIPTSDGLQLLVSTPSTSGDTALLFGFTRRRDSAGVFVQRFVRFDFDTLLSVRNEVVIDATTDGPSYNHVISVSGGTIFRTRGCNNAFRFNASLLFMIVGFQGQWKEHIVERGMVLDANGVGRAGGDSSINYCPGVKVSRAVSEVGSSVVVHGDTISVATTGLPVNISERTPALDVSGDSVTIAWWAWPSSYVAHTWPDFRDTITHHVELMVPPRIDNNAPGNFAGYMSDEVMYHSSGHVTLLADHFRVQRVPVPVDKSESWYYNYYACHTLTSFGWKRTMLAEGGGMHLNMSINPKPHSHDPDSGYTTGAFGIATEGTNLTRYAVFAIDRHGAIVDSFWSATRLVQGNVVLYDRAKQYLDCGTDEVRVVTKDSNFTIMQFDDNADGVWYQKLRGRHLLRAWRDIADTSILRVERYEIGGARVGVAEVKLTSKVGRIAYAEADDGRLFIVHADAGVYVYALNPSLTSLGDSVRISRPESRGANPSAVIVRDTLLVVWEDHRGDAPDIYGTSIDINAIPTRVAPDKRGDRNYVVSAMPVPANDYIDLTLSAQ